jgi:WD40 repeat protein
MSLRLSAAYLQRSLTFRTTISQKKILQELQTLRNFVQKALKDSLTSEEEASDPTITLQVGNLIGLANSAERFRIAASTTASSRHEPEEQPWSVPGSEHGVLSDDKRQQIERWAVLPEDTITETTASKVKEGSIVVNSNSSLKDISAPSATSESNYEIQTVYGHTGTVNSAVFSPSGRILASGSDDATIRTWEVVKSGQLQQLQTLEDLGGAVSKLVFSPDGESLAGIVGGNEIYVWNLDGKNQLRQTEKLTLGSAQFLSMAFSPSTMEPFFVTGLRDGRILQWHSDFTPDRTYSGLDSPSGIGVISISFFQRFTRQYLISGSQNGNIQIYKWSSSGSVFGILSKFKKPSPVPAPNYWYKEWSYQSAMAEAVSAIVCTSTHVVMGLPNHTSLVVEYYPSPGYHLRTDPRQHPTYSGHTDEVCCIATTRQGHSFASGSEDHSIKIWSLYSNKALNTLNGHSKAVRSVSFSPDGRRLVSASADHTIRVWRLRQ